MATRKARSVPEQSLLGVPLKFERKKNGTSFLTKQIEQISYDDYRYERDGSAEENDLFIEIIERIAGHIGKRCVPVCFMLPDGPAALDKGRVKMAERIGRIDLQIEEGFVTHVCLRSVSTSTVLSVVSGAADSTNAPAVGPPDSAQRIAGTSENPGEAQSEIRRLQRLIADRSGQSAFRQRMLELYEGQCAITGAGVSAALEAAHIRPWSDSQDDDSGNGVLLRADLHALFDAKLITVNPITWQVCVAQPLTHDPIYRDLHGARLRQRRSDDAWPSAKRCGHTTRPFWTGAR